MSDRELEIYNNLDLKDLELTIFELNKERMDIVEAIEEDKIDEVYGEKKYKKVDKNTVNCTFCLKND